MEFTSSSSSTHTHAAIPPINKISIWRNLCTWVVDLLFGQRDIYFVVQLTFNLSYRESSSIRSLSFLSLCHLRCVARYFAVFQPANWCGFCFHIFSIKLKHHLEWSMICWRARAIPVCYTYIHLKAIQGKCYAIAANIQNGCNINPPRFKFSCQHYYVNWPF